MTTGTNFKVGIASNKCNVNLAFSDSDQGWAYYSSGYLRHSSGGDGAKYGEPFTKGAVIGIYVDLEVGKLFFSKDGVVFPTAFDNSKFLEMELYPACSCLLVNESF